MVMILKHIGPWMCWSVVSTVPVADPNAQTIPNIVTLSDCEARQSSLPNLVADSNALYWEFSPIKYILYFPRINTSQIFGADQSGFAKNLSLAIFAQWRLRSHRHQHFDVNRSDGRNTEDQPSNQIRTAFHWPTLLQYHCQSPSIASKLKTPIHDISWLFEWSKCRRTRPSTDPKYRSMCLLKCPLHPHTVFPKRNTIVLNAGSDLFLIKF